MANAVSCRGPKDAAAGRAGALLAWYDANARDLPWRTMPGPGVAGRTPDPYRIWLSEVMLQQTTVATVRTRFREFVARWPNVAALADAPLDDVLAAWAGLGYYARARNLHACARVVASELGGFFPDTEDGLRKLPGVGPYTAAAIAAIAFGRRAIVVDGNIERVSTRLFRIERPARDAKAEIRERLGAIWPAARSGDFAQALMDLGATVCTPIKPSCPSCPIRTGCAVAGEGADAYPRKLAKAARPLRAGVAWALFDAKGRVLLVRRPPRGLLGGMLALPSAGWSDADDAPPADAVWRDAGSIDHVFTHFRLSLAVKAAMAPPKVLSGTGSIWAEAGTARLPTAMRKALDLAVAAQKSSAE